MEVYVCLSILLWEDFRRNLMGHFEICWCFGIAVAQLALGRVELNAIWQQVSSPERA